MNPFTDLPDVASEACGAVAIEASDDFFAPKENLIRTDAPIFIPGKYTDKGKWMDGWESRRKRTPGHDWCIVRLGFPAALHAVDVDTSHFLGNFPSHCSLEARMGDGPWFPQLDRVRLQGGTHNLFELSGAAGPFDHVRLNIFPDGGVARLHVYGTGLPDHTSRRPMDLACAANGGLVLAASDMFFGSKNNLILPGRPANMGGGWETRRRRGPGYDWIIVRLGAPGAIRSIRVETEHYKGNYPDSCSVDACWSENAAAQDLAIGRIAWEEIVPRQKLEADATHEFPVEAGTQRSHVRLNIYPDGGISRLRVFASLPES
ncbi:MAG: allantoicase [Bryobacteraceae bacterium]